MDLSLIINKLSSYFCSHFQHIILHYVIINDNKKMRYSISYFHQYYFPYPYLIFYIGVPENLLLGGHKHSFLIEGSMMISNLIPNKYKTIPNNSH